MKPLSIRNDQKKKLTGESYTSSTLEAQTLEEPAVAAGVVASLEQLPHQLLRPGLLRRIRDVDAAAELPRQVHVVPRRQKVFVVHDTQEHAHARTALDGALAHAADNLLRVLLHAGDQ
ncbi:hypothetical protein TcCL_ESM11548, partial [Trypanosoma cruzi]